MPATCLMDGYTAEIRVSRSGTQTTYFAEDYNCLHRRDVSYAKGIGPALDFLDQVARAP